MTIQDTLVEIPLITKGAAADVVNVPVMISDISTLSVSSFEFEAKCDPTKAKIEGFVLDGALTEDWMTAFNNYKGLYNASKIILVGANATSAKTGNVLFYLKVRCLVDVGDVGSIIVMPTYLLLNETLVLGSKSVA